MTVITTQSYVTYNGNDAATVWSFAFIVPTGTMQVHVWNETTGSVLVDPSEYTVVGYDNPAGGTVTYPLVGSPLATGSTITIQRILPAVQTTDISNQANFYPEVIEDALDYLTLLYQQLTALDDSSIITGAHINASKISTGIVSNTEFDYLDGLTGGIQGQLNFLQGEIDNIGTGAPLQKYWTPQQFGYITGSGSDAGAATQSAINAALAAGGGVVYFPPDTYNFTLPSPPPADGKTILNPGNGNIRFIGASRDTSILKYDEGPDVSHPYYLFKSSANGTDPLKGGLSFEHLQFTGLRGCLAGYLGGNTMYCDRYAYIRIYDCKFYNIASVSMDPHFLELFECDSCIIESTAADGIRARDCNNTIITNNRVNRTGDDGISAHTGNTIPHERIIISNNHLTNIAGRGIVSAGAVKMVVTENVIHLAGFYGVSCAGTFSGEGLNQQHSVVITDNVITDPMYTDPSLFLSSGNYIEVRSKAAQAGNAPNNKKPLRYNASIGKVVKPWDWYTTLQNDSTKPYPPPEAFIISGNICRRTLPNAAAFSDYGYGTRLFNGNSMDPATTDTIQRVGAGISIGGNADIVNLTIENNIFEHMSIGIGGGDNPTTNLDVIGLVVRGNTFFDVVTWGMLLAFTGGPFFGSGIIENNIFNMDFYREAPNSNFDGTYDTNTNPTVIHHPALSGFIVRNNVFANCCTVGLYDQTLNIYENNTQITGTPVNVDAFSVSNKGLGWVNTGFGSWRTIIVDADSTSATYMALQNQLLTSASAKPTTGWYPIGWIVWNRAVTVGGAVAGWIRTTTGTGHVLNTDWIELNI